MTAFIAIISAALMTELSANFLLSHALVNRVANEATDNSAIEQSLSQLQAQPLNSPCPPLSNAAVNNQTAVVTYQSCWTTVRESAKVVPVGGSGSQFTRDGARVQVNGFNDFVVPDSNGHLFDFPSGWVGPRWTLALGGQVTATPLVIPRPGSGSQVLVVIPLTGPGCAPATNCLNVRIDDGSANPPSLFCTQATTSGSPVLTQPGLSGSTPGLVFFGDGKLLEAVDVSGQSGGLCDFETSVLIDDNAAVVAGPVAYRCNSGCGTTNDYVYAVTLESGASRLLEYTYGKTTLGFVNQASLVSSNPVGLAVSGASLPAQVAITFGTGWVEVVQLGSGGGMSGARTATAGGAIADAPYWCHIPCGDLIGVATTNGGVYLYNAALASVGTYAPGGPGIFTTPAADGAGNWYFGANDGAVHELQLNGGQLTQVDSFGQMGGQVGSSLSLSTCPFYGICVYVGALDNHVYLVPLDARRAVISACISSAPPTCSGANPRLWANVEVGAAGSPQSVHVQGWSYYSA